MKTYCRCMWALLGFLVMAGCSQTEAPAKSSTKGPNASAAPHAAPSSPDLASGPVLETMDAGGYTYVKINVDGQNIWAAGPVTSVKVGDQVSIPTGQPMQNFHSKTLNRTFETIYFVPEIGSVSGASSGAKANHPHGMMGMPSAPKTAVDVSGITKAEGGQTIGEIFKNKASLANQEVLVRGKVVKFNAQILGKNWLHIRDGTGEADANDLTVTTQDAVAVGDTVLVRGTLATDKDFGAGYAYDLIVEKASVKKE